LRVELDASGLSALAAVALGRPAFPVDAIFFDKQPDANWSVPGHQDRLMPGWAGSTTPKAVRHGIEYFEPPLSTLAALVALRVHFDDADAGGLEVVPSSHRQGILEAEAIRNIPLTEYRPCAATRGDVLLMRPLLLHRSRRRTARGHRRVLHVVYASGSATDGARWKDSA
jgi:ectoine hydroxylase-related dioxygenase (phytanoyl-CoA dioxygenase family)